MTYKVGDKIKFREEKKPYRIIACDSRFLVCVKPFNLLHTYLYTVVDLLEYRRGPENLVLGHGYNLFDKDDCELFLKDFQSGKLEVSGRRGLRLDIV